MEKVKEDVNLLHDLIRQHDVIFLLTDSRESRWLPTVIGSVEQKVSFCFIRFYLIDKLLLLFRLFYVVLLVLILMLLFVMVYQPASQNHLQQHIKIFYQAI